MALVKEVDAGYLHPRLQGAVWSCPLDDELELIKHIQVFLDLMQELAKLRSVLRTCGSESVTSEKATKR